MLRWIKEQIKNWKWTPARAGFIIGVCILLGYFYYSLTGFCAGWYVGDTLSWIEHKATDNAVLFRGIPAVFATPVIGMLIGALLAAWKSKEFRFKKPNPKYLVYAVVGGIMIGFGNFLGAGCPIRHGIVGFAGLAIESWIAFPAMIIGVLLGTKLMIKYLA